MAKRKNYDELIANIEGKIQDRKEQIKKLDAQLKELRAEQSEEKNRELLEMMEKRNISPQDAINVLNERFPG